MIVIYGTLKKKKIVAGSYLLMFDLCFSLSGQLNDSHIGSYEEGSNNKKKMKQKIIKLRQSNDSSWTPGLMQTHHQIYWYGLVTPPTYNFLLPDLWIHNRTQRQAAHTHHWTWFLRVTPILDTGGVHFLAFLGPVTVNIVKRTWIHTFMLVMTTFFYFFFPSFHGKSNQHNLLFKWRDESGLKNSVNIFLSSWFLICVLLLVFSSPFLINQSPTPSK